jgi:hypothetical protein
MDFQFWFWERSVLFCVPPFEIIAIVLFAFSLATASVFVLNQYFDREADRENEVKSNLPVASGRTTPRSNSNLGLRITRKNSKLLKGLERSLKRHVRVLCT